MKYLPFTSTVTQSFNWYSLCVLILAILYPYSKGIVIGSYNKHQKSTQNCTLKC